MSKNNRELIQKRMSQRYTKWALRRLTVGVASVTIATGFFFMAGGGLTNPVTVHAATNIDEQVAASADHQSTTKELGKNADLSILPDNINWTSPRHDKPLNGGNENDFNKGEDQKPGAIIYDPIQQQGGDGYNVKLPTNNDQFGYTIDGKVGISKTGEAINDGTGTSGIINPDNKDNIIWLGKYGEPTSGNLSVALDSIGNKNELPKGTKYEYVGGWFKPQGNDKYPFLHVPAQKGEAGAKYFPPFSGQKFRVYLVMDKITYPNGTTFYIPIRIAFGSTWNLGIHKDIAVKSGEKLEITPTWVSNGNVNGQDQLKMVIYDADDPQNQSLYNAYATPNPLATFTTESNTGKQTFKFVVPKGVAKLRVSFLPANTTVNHTGLTNNNDILVSGFTGVAIHQVTDADRQNPVGKPINTEVGKTPDPSKGISNFPDLPDVTKYSWKEVPDITESAVNAPTKATNTLAENNNVTKQTLPQTGNTNEQGTVLLGVISALLALFGLAKRRKINL